MFVPIDISVHIYVYFTQINYTAPLQLIKCPHDLSYEQNSKSILTLSITHTFNIKH